MAYRNKTFVSFASEDIHCYRLMTAWKANENIDFNFYDAHGFYTALDTSQPETIRRRIRERLANTKQVILLVGDKTRAKAADANSFIYYEMYVIKQLDLPIVIVNLNKSRMAESARIPAQILDVYTISVSFQPTIIKYALDSFPATFASNLAAAAPVSGPHQYNGSVYKSLGL